MNQIELIFPPRFDFKENKVGFLQQEIERLKTKLDVADKKAQRQRQIIGALTKKK